MQVRSWLLDLPIKKKLYLIIGLLIGNITFVISLGIFAFNTLSAIRASVAAEGLWAKAQKTAFFSLGNYALSQDEHAYEDYLDALRIPQVYELANSELRKPRPDAKVLDQAFIDGGIDPDDAPGVDRLFLYFQKVIPHVAEAFRAWGQAQQLVDELQGIGRELHAYILTKGATQADLARFVLQIEDRNKKTTTFEVRFSSELGKASRWATVVIMWAMISGSAVIGLLSVAIALYISGAIVTGIDNISHAASQAAQGNLQVRVSTGGKDELGKLGDAFNHMVRGLGQIDRLKTEFFANVSHEFRTPLTLILGPLETILARSQEQRKPDVRQNVVLAHRNAVRLLKLVNTLLDFSRIQAGKAEAAFAPTDLAALTCGLAGSFRSAIETCGIELVVDCPLLPEPVFVDRDMWEKIVLNLISNAFKFTMQGRITVSQHVRDGRVELAVADTGAGIPSAELNNLFRRFFRIEGTPRRSHEGTGIGLALIDELVKLNGGTIRVASELGHGSVFTVSVPLGKAHLAAEKVKVGTVALPSDSTADAYVTEALSWHTEEDGKAPVTEPSSEREDRPDPRPRLLLADDNADMRKYVIDILSPYYQVATAPDGEAAFSAVSARRPDLVLSDVMMPRLDGFGLLARLRGDPGLRSIPFVMLSARAGDESKVGGLTAGADDYLIKPFSARELLARIKANLEKAGLRLETARSEERLAATEKINTVLRQESERKDEFLAMLAHELRNPLSIISGVVQVAAVDGLETNSLAVLEHQVERIFYLIEGLLDISRINQGGIGLKMELVDAHLALNWAVASIHPLVRAKHQKFVTVTTSDPLPVMADQVRLEQIVLSLLDFAVNDTLEGGQIRLEAGYEGRDIAIQVRHNAVRMSAEGLGPPFASSSEPRLALVKTLTTLLGGTIAATAEGHSREYTVRLPFAQNSAPGSNVTFSEG